MTINYQVIRTETSLQTSVNRFQKNESLFSFKQIEGSESSGSEVSEFSGSEFSCYPLM